MSALLQSANLFRSLRSVSEPEAISMIGRSALTAVDAASGLESLACVALRLRGLQGVEVSVREQREEIFKWHAASGPAPVGSATGLMAANSRHWGRLRIFFEPRIKSVECPLRFARVLAQHAALMFNRLELTERKEAAQAAVKRLQERLETRKAMSRAAGILAEAQSLSHEEAIVVLLKHARESREPLLALARAVIGNEEEA